jgi:hypothetical protein
MKQSVWKSVALRVTAAVVLTIPIDLLRGSWPEVLFSVAGIPLTLSSFRLGRPTGRKLARWAARLLLLLSFAIAMWLVRLPVAVVVATMSARRSGHDFPYTLQSSVIAVAIFVGLAARLLGWSPSARAIGTWAVASVVVVLGASLILSSPAFLPKMLGGLGDTLTLLAWVAVASAELAWLCNGGATTTRPADEVRA